MAASSQSNSYILSPTLRLRAAEWKDLGGVTQLSLDACTADGDPAGAIPLEELRRDWKMEGFDLSRDAWVVETADGRIVGYEELINRHAHAVLLGDGYVHPEMMGQGIGTALLRALDQRAREQAELAGPELRVFVRNGLAIGDAVGRAMHEAEGYRAIRFSWHMEIDLASPPDEPHWPAGMELRPFALNAHNEAVFQAHEEAFSDHWGHVPGTFTRWEQRMTSAEDFDPSLWFIAWDSDRVAGYSLCRVRNDLAWVGTLGVRRPWRKRGLGMALLQHSFGEFYRRGKRKIALGVDASNPTGATRLYEKAGMRVAAEYVVYEKESRPGRDIAEQT